MKKGIMFVLIMLFMACACTQAFAVNQGENVDVDVSISTTDAAYVKLTISYDESAFEYVSSTCTGSNATTNGATWVMYVNSGVVNTGKIGTVTLKVKDDAKPGTYKVSATVNEAWNIDENGATVKVTGDKVTIECLHKETEWKIDKEPTCLEAGTENSVCKVCDKVMDTRDVDALGHDDGAWKTTVEPTCTENGIQELQCTRCAFKLDEASIDALGHQDSEWIIVVEPTCTEKGSKELMCPRCKEVYDTEDIDALGHDDGEWKVTLEPTCVKEGSKNLVCTRCEVVLKTEAIDSLGHQEGTWKVTVEATCLEKGQKEMACPRCGEVFETAEVEALGHDSGRWVVIKNPTATEPGIKQLKCTRCDEILDEKEYTQVILTGRNITVFGLKLSEILENCDECNDRILPVVLDDNCEYVYPVITALRTVVGYLKINTTDGKVNFAFQWKNSVTVNDVHVYLFDDISEFSSDLEAVLADHEITDGYSLAELTDGKAIIYLTGNIDYDMLENDLDFVDVSGAEYDAYINELMALVD